ncbi:hypothetical protein [Parageobacillus toebii]|uniref:hypothetical protein n=1 Tax=Parageobacillus toebii TaxID=153151 RepID=UPI0019685A6C|nr:hypothetical protein [Parageobacillus toebii]QSB49016.1 hypothetical protein JTI59_01265 [Parageobacillus toebii]
MTIVRLGYVAMSVHLQNCSPSQTMTFAQFQKIHDRDEAIKMHISSPKSDKEFRAHHDFVDAQLFLSFLHEIKGTVEQLDCMIEAKQKDEALFHLVSNLRSFPEIEWIDGASFLIR